VLLEYDLEIKPTKLIKGQGLAKLMAQTNCELLGINFIADLSKGIEEERTPQISQKFLDPSNMHSPFSTFDLAYHSWIIGEVTHSLVNVCHGMCD
jgi:hypothetical protein